MTGKQNLTWRDVRVGIFIFTGLALLLFIILIVGTNTRKFTSKYTLHTFVPNVLSLNPGAYITIGGIKAGTIGDFEFTERDGLFGVHVSLFVEDKFANRVTTSSRATIKTLGILGDKFIEISLGKADEPMMQDGDYIPANNPFDFEALLPEVERAARSAPAVLELLESLLDKLQTGDGSFATMLNDKSVAENLNSTMAELAELLRTMNEANGTFGKLLHEPGLYDNLESATKNLDAVLAKTNEGKGTLGKMVNDSSLYVNLKSASANLDSLLSYANAGNGNVGKIFKDEKLYKSLDEMAQKINAILEDMKKYPQKYFKVEVF